MKLIHYSRLLEVMASANIGLLACGIDSSADMAHLNAELKKFYAKGDGEPASIGLLMYVAFRIGYTKGVKDMVGTKVTV